MRRVRYGDVSFEVPDEWVDLSVVTLAGGDSPRFAPNITVTRQPSSGAALADQARRQLKDIKRQFKSHKLIEEREEKLGTTEAYVLEHRVMSPERVLVRQIQFFFVHLDDLVVVTLACAEQELEARRPTLEAMARSFAVITA